MYEVPRLSNDFLKSFFCFLQIAIKSFRILIVEDYFNAL